jgi:hypothetical protein
MVQFLFMTRPGEAMTSLTCEQVGACLAPCIPYLTQGGEPSSKCCEGIKNIKASTPTTKEKRGMRVNALRMLPITSPI